MEPNLSPAQAKQRDRRYHRMPALRCTTDDDIRAFVRDIGVCLLFPVKGVELPSVYQAVAGFNKPTSIKHDDPTGRITWNVKDRAMSQRWWYYGKLIRGKATLVSLKLLPAFYALSENFGEDSDYIQLFSDGMLSVDARAIYEVLLANGPMNAIKLKRDSNFYGEEKKLKFDRARGELQANLMVLPTGVSEAGAWHYAFVYDVLHRWLPDVVQTAREISRSQARRMIAHQHRLNTIVCSPREMARLFGWSVSDAEQALAGE